MSRAAAIPRSIWMLGFVSLFMDVSSELIHSLLPVFLVSSLGASMMVVGAIEGFAEATALIVRVFSGTISDYIGKRKGLAVLGYGLGAVSKPLFALAVSVHWVFAARFMDRIGKGIRGAPRDALIADLAAPEIRGAAYGLRQSLDTVGAFLGPLLAVGLMILWAGDFRVVFWFAVIPAALAVLLLIYGVEEPRGAAGSQPRRSPIRWQMLGELGSACWWVVALGAVFTLARFSEAFLILRAHELGLAEAFTPLVLVVMNLVFAASAYPFGRMADRASRRVLLGAGLAVLVLADVTLARATGLPEVAAGVALWGLHMGMTQGLLAAMVADAAPVHMRGTAFGMFSLACGVAMLVASMLAGLLWDAIGAPATFFAGALFAVVAAGMLWADGRRARSAGH